MTIEVSETFKKKVSSNGNVERRKKCPPGMKRQGNQCVAIGGKEKVTNKKAAKKASITKKSQGSGAKNAANRKRKKANRLRKAMGLN